MWKGKEKHKDLSHVKKLGEAARRRSKAEFSLDSNSVENIPNLDTFFVGFGLWLSVKGDFHLWSIAKRILIDKYYMIILCIIVMINCNPIK